MVKSEKSAVTLSRIILSNPGCTIIVDNDSWHIAKPVPDGWNNFSNEQQDEWLDNEGDLACDDDFPDLGVSYGYGVLEALAHAIGVNVERV